MLEEGRDEGRLLEEQTAGRALEHRVAGLGEVGRKRGVAAAVDVRRRDFLEEGLVAELDRVRGELGLALDPARVDLVAGLPHDDVVDLVARRPARCCTGLEAGAEELGGSVLRRADGEKLVESRRRLAGEDFLVVPDQSLDLGLDHHLVVLAADDADVKVIGCATGRRGQRGIRVRDVRRELVAECGLDRLQSALGHPVLDLVRVRRTGGDVGQVGAGRDAVGDLVGRVAVGRQVNLDAARRLERLEDVLERLELGATPGGPHGYVGGGRAAAAAAAASATGREHEQCAETKRNSSRTTSC